jgi:membrane-associated protease RseP (regulator of RpoE activity)
LIGGLGGILAIVFFVTAHEFGHFAAAKALGMKATEFFFGFGPRLWSVRRGETEYGIKAIPLGGYVRIVGMNPLEEVDPADVGRTYREKPFWMKSVVVLAGVGMNFLLAYLILGGVVLANGVGQLSTTVDEVVPHFGEGQPSPAAAAGFRRGDRIVAVGGVPTPQWQDVAAALASHPGEEIVITVSRDGATIDLTPTLATRVDQQTGEKVGFLGVAPAIERHDVGFFEAATIGGRQLGTAVGLTFEVLGRLVRPESLVRLAGVLVGNTDVPDEYRPVSPIGVVNIGSQVQEIGVANFLILLATINVMLATLNVLPLYPLDGGHFAVALYEKVARRPANVRALAPVAALVIALFGFLGLVAIILDIVNPINL